MPLIKISAIDDFASWALWEIAGDHDELSAIRLFDQEKFELDEIHHPRKRLEWLAARNALRRLFEANNIPDSGIIKDGFGKPFLQDMVHHISIAHSFPYAVALFNREQPAGIDIERIQEKILKIRNKFLNTAELEAVENDHARMTVIWCAKEALYKLYGEKKLIFRDNLNIKPFELQKEGELTGNIIVDGNIANCRLKYSIIDEFVVCFTTC